MFVVSCTDVSRFLTLIFYFPPTPQSFLFDNDEFFSVPGWNLDVSWVLCTVSASIAALLVGGLAVSAYFLPPEDDGYNFLDDPIDV